MNFFIIAKNFFRRVVFSFFACFHTIVLPAFFSYNKFRIFILSVRYNKRKNREKYQFFCAASAKTAFRKKRVTGTEGRNMAKQNADRLDSQTKVVARAVDLFKEYGSSKNEDSRVVALNRVNVDFFRGQMTAIMGPSGSGKSTLMHCMAGLDMPTSGQVFVEDMEVSSMNQKQLTKLRRKEIGFIFQSFNLVPTLSAEENILLPLQISRRSIDREWFEEIVDVVGLRSRLKHRPGQLSGGQQQRVACARAIMARPSVIFADEPTGNLDSRSSSEVLEFLRKSVKEQGQTVIMVTHDPRAASYADRVLVLADGNIIRDMQQPSYGQILEVFAQSDEHEQAANIEKNSDSDSVFDRSGNSEQSGKGSAETSGESVANSQHEEAQTQAASFLSGEDINSDFNLSDYARENKTGADKTEENSANADAEKNFAEKNAAGEEAAESNAVNKETDGASFDSSQFSSSQFDMPSLDIPSLDLAPVPENGGISEELSAEIKAAEAETAEKQTGEAREDEK